MKVEERKGGVKVQRDEVGGIIPVNQLPPMQMRRLFISPLALNYSHSPCVCVYSCTFGPLIAVGGGDKPAWTKCVSKLNNKLFTSFISHACSSLVNTFKSICHPPTTTPLFLSLTPVISILSHTSIFVCRHCQWGLFRNEK